MKGIALSLENKNILVTGASSGIGRAIAIIVSKAGGNIILNGRNEERLQETYDLLEKGNHLIIAGDLSEEDTIDRICSSIPELDGLVFSAGINDKALLKTITRKAIDKVFDINFVSPVLLTKGLLRNKKVKKGCSIVLISSISSTYSTISNSLYAASKGALESLARVMALELASRSVRVNTIRPGVIDTPLIKSYALDDSMDNFINQIPLKRIGQPEDVANGVLFFLSDMSSWITGSVLNIDGGITLR